MLGLGEAFMFVLSILGEILNKQERLFDERYEIIAFPSLTVL